MKTSKEQAIHSFLGSMGNHNVENTTMMSAGASSSMLLAVLPSGQPTQHMHFYKSSIIDRDDQMALQQKFMAQNIILLSIACLGAMLLLATNLVGVLICKGYFKKKATAVPLTSTVPSLSYRGRYRATSSGRYSAVEQESIFEEVSRERLRIHLAMKSEVNQQRTKSLPLSVPRVVIISETASTMPPTRQNKVSLQLKSLFRKNVSDVPIPEEPTSICSDNLRVESPTTQRSHKRTTLIRIKQSPPRYPDEQEVSTSSGSRSDRFPPTAALWNERHSE